LRDLHRPVKNCSPHAGVSGALFDESRVDFLEEARDGGRDGGADLDKGLGDRVDRFDVSKGGTLKDVDVVEGPAVDMGKRQEIIQP